MSALDTLSNLISPDTVRVALRQSPEYVANRNRVGAMLHDGLAAMDVYQQWKPAIFIASLIGAAASGYAFEKRGRRPKNLEAMVMYGALFAVCSTAAWITRPSLGGAAVPADASPADVAADPQGAATVGWIDRRVAALSAEDPNFADEAFARLVQMPGISGQFQKLNPVIQAAVL
jgi:hypothetical protein